MITTRKCVLDYAEKHNGEKGIDKWLYANDGSMVYHVDRMWKLDMDGCDIAIEGNEFMDYDDMEYNGSFFTVGQKVDSTCVIADSFEEAVKDIKIMLSDKKDYEKELVVRLQALHRFSELHNIEKFDKEKLQEALKDNNLRKFLKNLHAQATNEYGEVDWKDMYEAALRAINCLWNDTILVHPEGVLVSIKISNIVSVTFVYPNLCEEIAEVRTATDIYRISSEEDYYSYVCLKLLFDSTSHNTNRIL